MSQQAMARSREKDNENKKEMKAIGLSSTNCMEAACTQACASVAGAQTAPGTQCHGLKDLSKLQDGSAAARVARGSCREALGEF